jgi:hypothetical protein
MLIFKISAVNIRPDAKLTAETKFVEGKFAEISRKHEYLNFLSQNETLYAYNSSFAILDQCNENNCNKIFGYCATDKICLCREGFANYLPDRNINDLSQEYQNYANIPCSYSRKRQLITFLLEFLVPVGAGHLYLGNALLGVVKFFVCVLLPLIGLYVFCHCVDTTESEKAERINNIIGLITFIVYAITFGVWWLTDLIMIGGGHYKDSNQIEMAAW